VREETFELKVTLAGAQGGDRQLTGNGELIVNTIDALLMDPRLMKFELVRKPTNDREVLRQTGEGIPSDTPPRPDTWDDSDWSPPWDAAMRSAAEL
jgi:hypothetical protein